MNPLVGGQREQGGDGNYGRCQRLEIALGGSEHSDVPTMNRIERSAENDYSWRAAAVGGEGAQAEKRWAKVGSNRFVNG